MWIQITSKKNWYEREVWLQWNGGKCMRIDKKRTVTKKQNKTKKLKQKDSLQVEEDVQGTDRCDMMLCFRFVQLLCFRFVQ